MIRSAYWPAVTLFLGAASAFQSASYAANAHNVRASTLIGAEVTNKQAQNLGEIRDLIVDFNNSRVHYAVLEFGGFLGMGEKLFAYPIRVFSTEGATRADSLLLNVDKERLRAAPGFDRQRWPNWDDGAQYRNEVDKFYGDTVRIEPRPNMRLIRASEVLDDDIDDVNGKDVGELKDFVVDMNTGIVRYAVVDVDNGWRAEDTLLMLPVTAIAMSDADGDDMRLQVSRDNLNALPTFTTDAWVGMNLNDSTLSAEIDQKLRRFPAARADSPRTRNESSADARPLPTATEAPANTQTQADSAKPTKQDARYLSDMAQSHRAEIAAGKLALDKASSAQVREFAQKMIDAHTQMLNEVNAVIREKGVETAAKPKADQDRDLKKLEALSGQKFDDAYMRMMVKKHEKALSFAKKVADKANATEVKTLASNAIPHIEGHLTQARQLAKTPASADSADAGK